MKTVNRWSVFGFALAVFCLFTSVNSPNVVNSRLWWLGFAWQLGAGVLVGVSIAKVASKLSVADELQSLLQERGYNVPVTVLLDAPNWAWIQEKIETFEADPEAFGSLVELLKKA